MLNCSAERENGGFAVHSAARTGGGRISEVIPCLTGNMVWVLIRFGYLGDPRLQMSVEWLNRFMRFNDGLEENPQVAPYDRLAAGAAYLLWRVALGPRRDTGEQRSAEQSTSAKRRIPSVFNVEKAMTDEGPKLVVETLVSRHVPDGYPRGVTS